MVFSALWGNILTLSFLLFRSTGFGPTDQTQICLDLRKHLTNSPNIHQALLSQCLLYQSKTNKMLKI